MLPLQRISRSLILICCLIPMLAAGEAAPPEPIRTETETSVQSMPGSEEVRRGLEETVPAQDGQPGESAQPSGTIEKRGSPPPLGLCDGSLYRVRKEQRGALSR